ncbi:MAG: HPr family phosphocarrier protein [Ignavibacteria bacterium]|nr:HPr family phosphocarrier protein [Ignavibacteria bacterium]
MNTPFTTDPQEISKTLVVQNKMGMHARPAAMVVRAANRYPSLEVSVRKGKEQVNGKSIMGLMMLAAGKGTSLEFHVSGLDAQKLIDELVLLFERKFEED